MRKKITFSFDEVQFFYFLKEFRKNIVRFFFVSFIWTFRTSGTCCLTTSVEILGTPNFQHETWWQFSALCYASQYETFSMGKHRPITVKTNFTIKCDSAGLNNCCDFFSSKSDWCLNCGVCFSPCKENKHERFWCVSVVCCVCLSRLKHAKTW